MPQFIYDDLMALERRYRANFVNSLAGYRSAVLVGSVDAEDATNLAIFNSTIHIGANPPLMGLLCRPPTPKHQTLANISATGAYTINAVRRDMIQAAHQTSASYDKATSEFEACGLTPVYFEGHRAPAVQESPIRIGLSLVEQIEIKLNGTALVIGRVEHVYVADGLLQEDGHLRPDQADLVCCGGLDTYFLPSFVERLGYARVDGG